jgi:hypothetical protein
MVFIDYPGKEKRRANNQHLPEMNQAGPRNQKSPHSNFPFSRGPSDTAKAPGGWSNGQDRVHVLREGYISRYVLPRSLPATPVPHTL